MGLHFSDHGHHALFDFQAVNCVVSLVAIEFEEFHAAVIVDQLQHREVIATDALQGFHFVHNDVRQLFVLDLGPDEFGDRDVVVELYVLLQELGLGRRFFRVG